MSKTLRTFVVSVVICTMMCVFTVNGFAGGVEVYGKLEYDADFTYGAYWRQNSKFDLSLRLGELYGNTGVESSLVITGGDLNSSEVSVSPKLHSVRGWTVLQGAKITVGDLWLPYCQNVLWTGLRGVEIQKSLFGFDIKGFAGVTGGSTEQNHHIGIVASRKLSDNVTVAVFSAMDKMNSVVKRESVSIAQTSIGEHELYLHEASTKGFSYLLENEWFREVRDTDLGGGNVEHGYFIDKYLLYPIMAGEKQPVLELVMGNTYKVSVSKDKINWTTITEETRPIFDGTTVSLNWVIPKEYTDNGYMYMKFENSDAYQLEQWGAILCTVKIDQVEVVTDMNPLGSNITTGIQADAKLTDNINVAAFLGSYNKKDGYGKVQAEDSLLDLTIRANKVVLDNLGVSVGYASRGKDYTPPRAASPLALGKTNVTGTVTYSFSDVGIKFETGIKWDDESKEKDSTYKLTASKGDLKGFALTGEIQRSFDNSGDLQSGHTNLYATRGITPWLIGTLAAEVPTGGTFGVDTVFVEGKAQFGNALSAKLRLRPSKTAYALDEKVFSVNYVIGF